MDIQKNNIESASGRTGIEQRLKNNKQIVSLKLLQTM